MTRETCNNADMVDVLDNGIKCLVWDFEQWRQHEDLFIKYMAADNTRAMTDMPDDELSIVQRMQLAQDRVENSGGIDPTGASSSVAGPVITEGSRFFDRVMAEVHRQGPMPFDNSECELIWKFVAVTPAEVINLFKGQGLHEHLCDPQARGVSPRFLADLAALTPGAPFVLSLIHI